MTFESKFRKKNSKIAASSVTTYLANIRRLARALGHDEVPAGGAWLGKAPAWLRKQNLNTRKILAAAAVKAAQSYGRKHEVLSRIMSDAGEQYDKVRQKGKKTKREAALMPKDGFAAVARAATKMRGQLPATVRTMKDYMRLQDAWLLSFYAKHTPRLINSVQIGRGENKITEKGSKYTLTLTKHKTAKSMGPVTIRLHKSLNPLTQRLIKSRPPAIRHHFLLSAPRGGRMSASQLSTRLRKITSKEIGRGFGAQILRVLRATDSSKEMDKVREYLQEMGHGLKQEKKYVAK